MNIEIANRLANLRKESGMSQEELAQKLGISRQAVSKWERAESSPDTDNLIALSKLYNVSLDKLLEADEESIENETFARQYSKDNDTKSNNSNENYDNNNCENEPFSDAKMPLGWAIVFRTFPIFIVAIYFILNWLTGARHLTWLVFLSIPIFYVFSSLYWVRKQKDN